MLIILGILAAAALGGIIFLFVSPKTAGLQKKAALGALLLCGLALGICTAVIVVNIAGENKDPYAFEPEAVEIKSGNSNMPELLIFLVILLAVFAFILFMYRRDRKKQAEKKDPVSKLP